VHLEGAIRPARLGRILEKHALHPGLRRPEDLGFLYQHADFGAFLDHFRFAVLALRDVQDVHDVALDLFRELAAQNVVYAEVIFSAAIFVRAGMPLDELLAAVAAAEETALGERGSNAEGILSPRYNLVIDVVRNFGSEAARRLVTDLARLAHPRVVGVHLGGDEVGFPAADFETAFAVAREAGLGCAAHAGEAAGAPSVWDAIDRLGAQRIGHGIRSLEDPVLVAELVRRRITLEVCPTSNLRTGVVSDLAAHPLPALLDAGIAVTLGADDPSFFDTNLETELWLAHTVLGLPLDVVHGFAVAGLEASFLTETERAARLRDLEARAVSARIPR
jgi:adenosine deaminase